MAGRVSGLGLGGWEWTGQGWGKEGGQLEKIEGEMWQGQGTGWERGGRRGKEGRYGKRELG